MPPRRRLLISLLIGLLAGTLCYAQLVHRHMRAADFTWVLHGARTLLAGGDPYHDPTLPASLPYDPQSGLYYPFPVLIACLPFAYLPDELAGGLFFGLSSALLAWGLLAQGYWRLALFLSVPYWISLLDCNWLVIIVAAFLIPGLEWLYVFKPNIGLALFAAKPSWRAVILCAVALALSLLVRPHWPLDWWSVLGSSGLVAPVLVFPGFLLLLAALRWRDWRGRLLLAMALVPQRLLFYDQMPLMLIPASLRETLVIAIIGWATFWLAGERWFVALIYLPLLVLVLRPLIKEALQSKARPAVDD